METARAIVWITCGISLLSGIMDALKPDKRFDKQMRLILSAVYILAILSPFAGGKIPFRYDVPKNTSIAVSLEDTVAEQTASCAARNLETSIQTLLQDHHITDAEVLVSVHTEEDGSINIDHVTVSCMDTVSADRLLKECLGEEVNFDVEKAS